MSAFIAGMGWVTPLGADLEGVRRLIESGVQPRLQSVTNPESGKEHRCFRVPPELVAHLGRNPRLRRSSVISYFAIAAALAACEDAGLVLTPETAARTAVIFAVSDGGVVYTRKFYEQVVKQGANAASPLLFAETVYNAPASHLAAQLGIDGASYTLVGDASAAIAALKMGEQLLALRGIDQCVVVACEELDWILCEAYNVWRLARTPLSEGAAAVVLSGGGRCAIEAHPGIPFFRQRDAADALRRAIDELPGCGSFDVIVHGDNGTFIDKAASSALAQEPRIATASAFSTKRSIGETVAASALIDVIFCALQLRQIGAGAGLVPVIGFNHQVSAARITCKPQ